jgi:hypothetical protein
VKTLLRRDPETGVELLSEHRDVPRGPARIRYSIDVKPWRSSPESLLPSDAGDGVSWEGAFRRASSRISGAMKARNREQNGEGSGRNRLAALGAITPRSGQSASVAFQV